jgi:hypothetical protein
MSRQGLISSLRVGSQLINLLVLALGLAGGYFMTIQSLKLELAEKAETTVVETLDKRLGELEVILRETAVSREQFYEFSADVDRRLARIEYHLTDKRGEKREQP